MLPRAEETTTSLPARSFTLRTGESAGTISPFDPASPTLVAMIFSGTPPDAAISTGRSPA